MAVPIHISASDRSAALFENLAAVLGEKKNKIFEDAVSLYHDHLLLNLAEQRLAEYRQGKLDPLNAEVFERALGEN